MPTPTKIVFPTNSDREVHMLGESVGVFWNTRKEKKQIKGEDGITYSAIVPVRIETLAYIGFVNLREWDDGEITEDEDSPVEGGMSLAYAEVVSKELQNAIEYLRDVSH